MNVANRIDAIKAETKSIENDLRGCPSWAPERKQMQERLTRLARQIAMLTEAERAGQ